MIVMFTAPKNRKGRESAKLYHFMPFGSERAACNQRWTRNQRWLETRSTQPDVAKGEAKMCPHCKFHLERRDEAQSQIAA